MIKLILFIILIILTLLFETDKLKNIFTDNNSNNKSVIHQSDNKIKSSSINLKCKINYLRIPPLNSNWENEIYFKENFKNNLIKKNKKNNKCIIWMYTQDEVSPRFWSNFYSRRQKQDLPDYIKMCIKSNIIINSNDFEIIILNNEYIIKLFQYLLPFNWNCNNINNELKVDILKYTLLYNFGGIWIKPSTIVFKNFKYLEKLLKDNDVLSINDINNENLIIAGNKNSKILFFILNNLKKNLLYPKNEYLFNNYKINNLIKTSKIKYKNYLLNTESGNFDTNNQFITYKNILSKNQTFFKNKNEVIFFQIDNEIINKYNHYNWFKRLNESQLLKSNLWFSHLIKI